ncbi:MAG: BolA family transcriptional regulator [Methylotenera sp.]|jgi:BolA protein|uniref:BolA family transcriptional regulator n=1 Tax=Methylotenera mobilis TaxID=359408 RepID=A0A351RAT9_9PROT|nr:MULTISPECIES: BolA family protein [Methylotenera]MDP3775973.1 BolA family protein [Methylotenera sp.]PPC96394.1 MAG: BolA family transcriptional regulator [Methylotenera sp.]PPC97706.1 MAG: BolA family transcriptional regulator [Methylotenera sp.]HBA09160.1 BolA family transcriptional regulator [Methylotenera mobilis]
MIDEIKNRLQALAPTSVDLIDESAQHAGHKGNGGGGHYKLNITSSHFCGKSQIMRHRLVYQALADLIPHKVHALSIHAIATDEI